VQCIPAGPRAAPASQRPGEAPADDSRLARREGQRPAAVCKDRARGAREAGPSSCYHSHSQRPDLHGRPPRDDCFPPSHMKESTRGAVGIPPARTHAARQRGPAPPARRP